MLGGGVEGSENMGTSPLPPTVFPPANDDNRSASEESPSEQEDITDTEEGDGVAQEPSFDYLSDDDDVISYFFIIRRYYSASSNFTLRFWKERGRT